MTGGMEFDGALQLDKPNLVMSSNHSCLGAFLRLVMCRDKSLFFLNCSNRLIWLTHKILQIHLANYAISTR